MMLTIAKQRQNQHRTNYQLYFVKHKTSKQQKQQK